MQRESVSPLITLAFKHSTAKMQAVGVKMKCAFVRLMCVLVNSLLDTMLFSFAQLAL